MSMLSTLARNCPVPGRIHWKLFQAAKYHFVLSVGVFYAFVNIDQIHELHRYTHESWRHILLYGATACLFLIVLYMSFTAATRTLPHLARSVTVTRRLVLWLPALGLLYNVFAMSGGRDDALRSTGDLGLIEVVLLAAAIVLFLPVMFFVPIRPPSILSRTLILRLRRADTPVAAFLAVTCAAIGVLSFAVTLLFNVADFASYIGPLATLMLFVTVFSVFCALFALVYQTQRIPLVSALFAWAVFLAWSGLGTRPLVRQIPAASPQTTAPPLPEAFRTWLTQRPDLDRYKATKRPYPVYLIAAPGGGMSAAYQVAAILALLGDQCPLLLQHTFAISAVSGGSLGAVAARSLINEAASKGTTSCGSVGTAALRDRTDELLGQDFMAPLLWSTLFPGLFQKLIPFPIGSAGDRAASFEDLLKSRWAAKSGQPNPFEQDALVWTGSPLEGPSILFNATAIETGRRLVIAPYRLKEGNGIENAVDKLRPGHSVSHGTAIGISARFPWITQPASFAQQSGASYADGGYYDNSGLETIADIIEELSAVDTSVPIEFRVISPRSVTSGFFASREARTREPLELAAPIVALNSTRGARAELSIHRLDARLCRSCYQRLGDYWLGLGRVLRTVGLDMDLHLREPAEFDIIVRPTIDGWNTYRAKVEDAVRRGGSLEPAAIDEGARLLRRTVGAPEYPSRLWESMEALDPKGGAGGSTLNRFLLFLVDDESVAVPLGWTLSTATRRYFLRGTQSPDICFDIRQSIRMWLRDYDTFLQKSFEGYLARFIELAKDPQPGQERRPFGYYYALGAYREAMARSLDDVARDRLPPSLRERGLGLGTILFGGPGGSYRVGGPLLIEYACALTAHYNDLAKID
jgi:hypothetical protein